MKTRVIFFSVLLSIFGSFAKAENTNDLKQRLVQIVCRYDDAVTRKRNVYSACFQTNQECLESPIWEFRDSGSTYSVKGAFGYQCHFEVDKVSGSVVSFKLVDPGE